MFKFEKFTIAILIVLIGTMSAEAQEWQLVEKLNPANLAAADNLGISIDISESFLISGAWWKDQDVNGNFTSSAGAAYIFKLNQDGSWDEMQMLQSSAPEALGYFGFSIAIEENRAAVGAYNEDSPDGQFGNTGSVYIYELKQNGLWDEVQKLVDPEPDNADYFGYNMSLSWPYLLVGAYREQQDALGANTLLDAGAAYIYKHENGEWLLLQKLVPDDRAKDDEFGRYLDIHGQTAVIGANLKDNDLIIQQGAAYIFELNEGSGLWEQKQKLLADDGSFFDDFGWSVAVDGNQVMVAASSESTQPDGNIAGNTGAVYCYEKNPSGEWEFSQKIYAPDFHGNDFFGRSIDIHDDVAIIGAETESEDENGENFVGGAGSAYIFQKSGSEWVFQQKVVGTNRQANDLFGASVAVHKPNIAIGAWRADGQQGLDQGAAYIFNNDEVSTGLSDHSNLENRTIVFPNPSNGSINLGIEANNIRSLSLYDVDGNLIFQSNFLGSFQFAAQNCSSGIYVIVLQKVVGEDEILRWIKSNY